MIKWYAMNSGPATTTLDGAVVRTFSIKRHLETIFNTLLAWQARANERRQLGELEPYLLQDLGLTQDAVYQEIAKPFWRP